MCGFTYFVAKEKNRDSLVRFWLGFYFQLVALIAIVVLPKLPERIRFVSPLRLQHRLIGSVIQLGYLSKKRANGSEKRNEQTMLTILKERINYFAHPPIIQFSPPRTGSTLLWNTLRVCFPEREVKKVHRLSKFEKNYRSAPIVASIRNPLDSISSSIQRYGK